MPAPRKEPQPETLPALIKRRLAEMGLTYDEAEARMPRQCEVEGSGIGPDDPRAQEPAITSGYLQQIAYNQVRQPGLRIVRALAMCLDVTEEQVWDAVGAGLGVKITSKRTRLELALPPGTDQLTDAQVRAIAQMTRAFLGDDD